MARTPYDPLKEYEFDPDFFPWTSVEKVPATLDWDADVTNPPTIGTSNYDGSDTPGTTTLLSLIDPEWVAATGAAAVILDELTEDDGGIRFTAKALEEVTIDVGDIELDASQVWQHPERTLTVPAVIAAEETSTERITRRRGDTWSISITGLGTIANRAALWFTLKRSTKNEDSAAVLQVTEDDGITIDNQTSGNVTIAVSAAVTAGIEPREYVYDIQVRRTNGQVVTLAIGTFVVDADVTRATEVEEEEEDEE